VKAHAGAIEVKSELQKGTRFVVTLPAGPAAPALTEAPAVPLTEQVH
jgi:signal transduction histidine kinase